MAAAAQKSMAAASSSDAAGSLASLLKTPLLNPALLTINPSLYAVQLAQLQAALAQSAGLQQLVAAASLPKKEDEGDSSSSAAAAASRKRKLEEEQVLNLTNKRTPPATVASP